MSCSAGGRAAGLALLAALSLSAAPAPVIGITSALRALYDAWTPVEADTTPLALLRKQALGWEAAVGQLSSLLDEANAYAELRGVSRLSDGRQSVGVLRAGLYRKSPAESVLVLNDEWCAAGLCKVRTRFVLLRPGQPDAPLDETQLVPRILDRDLLDDSAEAGPECLRGVTLGVQYLPSRYDTSLTVLATVPPKVRATCEQNGVEPDLVTRPLRLNWNAAARKFVRGW